MRFRAIKTSVALENGDCVIFYLYACGADGRTDVRSRDFISVAKSLG